MLNISVTILKPDFEPIGLMNDMTSLIWTERSDDIGEFQLFCPLTKENAEMLKRENLVWRGTKQVGIIETIDESTDEEGSKSLQVSGRFIDFWIDRRIILQPFFGQSTKIDLIKKFLDENAVSPEDEKRKIPYFSYRFEESALEGLKDPEISYQGQGENLYEKVKSLAGTLGLNTKVECDIRSKKIELIFYKKKDLSVETAKQNAVVMSTELSDILTSQYTLDATDYRNVVYVFGMNNKNIIMNDEDHIKSERMELYLDKTDMKDYDTWHVIEEVVGLENPGGPVTELIKAHGTIRKTEKNLRTGQVIVTERQFSYDLYYWNFEGGIGHIISGPMPEAYKEYDEDRPIPLEEYQSMLRQEGESLLLKNKLVEDFSCTVRMLGEKAYEIGVDYNLGDRITVVDNVLGIQLSTEVTELSESYDENEYTVDATFGTAAPTITKLIKQKR